MRFLVLVLLPVWGCGYKLYQPIQYKSISIPIFENSSERRTNEFELTNLVIKELQQKGVRVAESSDHILKCDIVDIAEPTLVMGSKEVLLVGSYSIRLRFQLIEKSTNKQLTQDVLYYQAPFSTLQGKTLEAARQEAMAHIAQVITTKLESKW